MIARPTTKAVFAAVLLGLLVSCARRAPVASAPKPPPSTETEKKQFDEAVGEAMAPLFMLERRPYDDAHLAAYVARIGARVAAHAGPGGAPTKKTYVFQLTDDEDINAWSLLGGHVFVARGILAALESEAELAGVLAHEIGHNEARHSVHSLFVAAGKITEDAAFGFDADAYDEEQEYQADHLGLESMRAAGYEPRSMMSMLEGIYRVESGGELAAYASWRETRIAHLWRGLENAAGGDVGRDRYLDAIEGLVAGEDPRSGVLHGATYSCAACGFSIDLPAGWKGVVAERRLKAERKGEGELELRRVSGDRATRDAIESRVKEMPFTEERFAGVPVVVSAWDGADVALVRMGDEGFMLSVSGDKRAGVLRKVLSTLRTIPKTKSDGEVDRVRVRAVKTRAPAPAAIAATCGSEHVERVLVLNGIPRDHAIEAGARLKCIGR